MHRVPMNGHCAVIARSNVWTKDQSDPTAAGRDEHLEGLFWDYRIKVDPWQVFGNVELEIVGEDIEVEHVWAANVVEMAPLDDGREGVRIKVELENKGQDDQQFDIDGTGVPSAAPTILGCANLEPVENDCKLTAAYSMLNSFEGTVSSKVHIETWQEGAMISLDFGDSEVEISEIWGATERDPEDVADIWQQTERDLDDEEVPPNLHVFRLMPYNHHMPTDRRSSFGFDATPPFHHLPVIHCIPSRPFPPPPPPSPPSAPPAPPPYIVTERTDCFLGGRVTFVTTPGETPGTLWEANVKMERWMAGAQLTLDFYGEQLYAHPLRVASIQPPDTVMQISHTAHSLVIELKNSPVREFNLLAYGKVEGLGKLACCCADMPSPPPPPPTPPPSPQPPRSFPRSPPSPVGSIEYEWGRGIVGHVAGPPPSPPPMPDAWLEREKTTSEQTTSLTALGVLCFGAVVLVLRRIVQEINSPHRRLPKPSAYMMGGAGGKRGRGGRTAGNDDAMMPMFDADEESAPTTKLHIEVSASEKCALKISMSGVSCMEDLQELVAEVCEEAGYRELDDLVMSYKRPDGEFATVTRSVTVDMLKSAPALRLAPAGGVAKPATKEKGGKEKGSKGGAGGKGRKR